MGKKKSKNTLPCYADVPNLELDVYDRALEQAVCQAPFFQENDLRLYQNADLWDFYPQGVLWGVYRVPYLLCKGPRALLAFRTFQKIREPDQRVDRGSVIELRFQKGTEEKALDILQKEVELILSQEEEPKRKYPVRPVAAKYWPDLVHEGLVERSRLPDGRLCWGLSLQGEKQGLYWGWWLENGKLREGPCKGRAARIALALPGKDRETKRRPLDQRLQDADDGYSRDLVERFAQTELWKYLHEYPTQLTMLEETLGVKPDAPFHQVAALIWERMGSDDRQTCESGVQMMCLLAAPLIRA